MLSQSFLARLEQSRKSEFNTQINEDGYSPFLFSVNISPSNRIQIKIHPHFESRGKSSKAQDSEIASYTRKLNTLTPPPPAEGGGHLASLPNCNAVQTAPFSMELEFQEWQEKQLLKAEKLTASLSPVPQLPRRKQFTRLARRTILDAAGALEKEGYQPSQFQFFTGTLPGSSPAACEYFARYSRHFLNAMKQGLRRLGLDLTFNCWEWQLRKRANLVPALHLHLVVLCEDEELASRLPQILEDMWFRLLIHYSSISGVDFFEKHDKLGGGRWTTEQLKKLSEREDNPLFTCKTIQCTKSVGAYLSKYVGKGSLAGDTDFQDRFKQGKVPLYYPSSWWSISDSIRELIKKHSASYSFKNNIAQCMAAYHSLTSILEDNEFDLIELALPVFIPEWGDGNRIYRNFYCKSEAYNACSELVATYSDNDENYKSNSHIFIHSTAESLRLKFESEDSRSLMSRLVLSLPLYCLQNGAVVWDNPIVIEKAFAIMNESVDYPTPESLEDRIKWQNHILSLSESELFERSKVRLNMYLN